MKTGKNATIIMTLAVVFITLVVPLSTLAGGGSRNLEFIIILS